MGRKRDDEKPLAIVRAEAYAREARKYGLKAEVRIERSEASYYRSTGEVMTPERLYAWVTVRDEWLGVFGDYLSAGWTSVRPTPGFSATTRFLGGHVSRTLLKTKKLSERGMASELANYRYRLADPAKYEIPEGEDTTPAVEWEGWE